MQELTDASISSLVADKVAQIHLMDVPINKQPKWLWQTMERSSNIFPQKDNFFFVPLIRNISNQPDYMLL